MNETNIEVQLQRATPVRLRHGSETVSRVRLYADDPAAFHNEARRFT